MGINVKKTPTVSCSLLIVNCMILGVLLRKELLQLRRNPFLPKLLVAFPLMVLLVMPWTMQMDIKNVHLTVLDNDQSSLSLRIRSHLSASSYFIDAGTYPDYQSASDAMDRSEVDVIVSIPQGFERNMLSEDRDPVLIEANGVNAMKGQLGIQYAMQTLYSTLKEYQAEHGLTTSLTEGQISVKEMYNPTGNVKFYMLPAIMIIVILLICGFMPALSIVMEKESGTIEMVNVTPVSRIEYILAKLIPYWVAGEVIFCEAMLLAGCFYGLWPLGGWSALITIIPASLLFVLVMSSFSLFIANVSDNLQQAVMLMFFFMMNFMLLSGILTPISSMPHGFRYITYLLPPRYIIHIMRSVYLKDTLLTELWPDFLALAIIASLFIFIAIRTYKKQS